ncbi:MAG: site-2 protease family protein, partial [Chloroflexota bacterium]
MRQRMIPLGKVFGIQVGLDYSWFLIIALLTSSLALNYFPAQFAGWSTALYWVLGGGAALMLFASVLLHEFGHSLVALAYHIPVRRIRLMFFGGVAEIGDEPTSATAEFRIAIAGPLVSFALAGLFYLAYAALNVTGALVPVTALLGYLALINLTLAIFNLVPAFPLDGGRVLRAAVWGITGDMSRSTRIAVGVGRVIAFAMIGAGVFQMLVGSFASGLWTMFIGFFVQPEVGRNAGRVRLHHLGDRPASQQVVDHLRAPLGSPGLLQEEPDEHRPQAIGNTADEYLEQTGSKQHDGDDPPHADRDAGRTAHIAGYAPDRGTEHTPTI